MQERTIVLYVQDLCARAGKLITIHEAENIVSNIGLNIFQRRIGEYAINKKRRKTGRF